MIPINQLKLETAPEARPGTLLIEAARYDRPPLFTCLLDEKAAAFALAPVPEGGFNIDYVGDGLGRWLSAGEATILVDPSSTISPTQSDIPWGAICLIGGEARIAVKCGHATRYVGLNGSLFDPDNFENFVAFGKWEIQVKGAGDDMFTVYESNPSTSAERA